MTSDRIAWIDELRGLAIVLVMLGHTYITKATHLVIYSFHVPLFFMVSGYLFSIKKYKTYKDFLKSRFMSLLLPMMLLGSCVMMISCVRDPDNMRKIPAFLAGLVIELRGSAFDSTLWFLTCLFVIEILFWFIAKKDNLVILGFSLAASITGFLYMRLIDHICPWAIEVAMVCMPFFCAGFLLKKIELQTSILRFIVGLIVFIGTMLLCRRISICPDVYANKVSLWPIYYSSAFSGSYVTLQLIRLLPCSRLLCFIGKNSLVFYAFHKEIYLWMSKIIPSRSWLTGLFHCSCAIIICAGVSIIISRYAPWMLGKRILKVPRGS